MRPSRTETEVKLPFDSYDQAIERLRQSGAEPVHERQFEDNVVYDRPDRALKAGDRLLRLRRTGAHALLTYKVPVPEGSRHKIREEFETPVGDAGTMGAILEQLGFQRVYRYQKYRTGFRLEGVEVSVDETPIGCYVELEGPPEAIDRAAGLLGISRDRYITSTYRDLQEQAAATGDAPAGDMLLADSETGNARLSADPEAGPER